MSCEVESHSLHNAVIGDKPRAKKRSFLCRGAKAKSAFFNAAIAQLVEHDLAKVGVASSSLVCRSY